MPNEALTVVKDLTTHMLTLGVGVFALVGGYLSSQDHRNLHGKRTLLVSLSLFGVSVVAGLVALMMLANLTIHSSAAKPPDLLDLGLRVSAGIQILVVVFAALVFFAYLCMNLWRR